MTTARAKNSGKNNDWQAPGGVPGQCHATRRTVEGFWKKGPAPLQYLGLAIFPAGACPVLPCAALFLSGQWLASGPLSVCSTSPWMRHQSDGLSSIPVASWGKH